MADVPEVLGKSETNVLETFDALLKYTATLGPYRADAKKSSIHLVRETGFAGVHPRKAYLVLNVRLGRELPENTRWKSEQVPGAVGTTRRGWRPRRTLTPRFRPF